MHNIISYIISIVQWISLPPFFRVGAKIVRPICLALKARGKNQATSRDLPRPERVDGKGDSRARWMNTRYYNANKINNHSTHRRQRRHATTSCTKRTTKDVLVLLLDPSRFSLDPTSKTPLLGIGTFIGIALIKSGLSLSYE